MEITKTLTGDLMHVAVAGRLDSYWADHLSDTLAKVVQQGHHRVRLDCADVNFLSSSGIRVLLQVHKQLAKIGGSFRVSNPSTAVMSVLQVSALVYGLYSIAESRPVYITFVKDRFELVRAGELDDADIEEGAPGFRSLSWFGYRLAGARLPKDPKEQLKHMDLAILGGKDVLAEHIVPGVEWLLSLGMGRPAARTSRDGVH